jgi:hypothetical protein
MHTHNVLITVESFMRKDFGVFHQNGVAMGLGIHVAKLRGVGHFWQWL